MSDAVNSLVRGDEVIARLGDARTALIAAKTVQATKKVLDLAAAAELYAKRQGMSEEAIGYAHEIKIEALAQLGKMLEAAPKNLGGRPETGAITEPVLEKAPTLSDMGLDKKTSALAQKVSKLPEDQLDRVKTRDVSVAQAIREVNHANRPDVVPPTGKYRVFYADPPWSYGDSGLQQYGHASFHYPPMTITELCEMPVKALAEDDAVLFLWVTSPMLEVSFKVIAAWGFQYKTSFVWDKVHHNFGHYNSVRHEFLLVCTRGSCTPDNLKLFDSVLTIERTEKHSEKPGAFREIIDTLYLSGDRIELFARASVEGWQVWGNEPT